MHHLIRRHEGAPQRAPALDRARMATDGQATSGDARAGLFLPGVVLVARDARAPGGLGDGCPPRGSSGQAAPAGVKTRAAVIIADSMTGYVLGGWGRRYSNLDAWTGKGMAILNKEPRHLCLGFFVPRGRVVWLRLNGKVWSGRCE